MPNYPTESEIRAALVARVNAYCEASGETPREVGKQALHDPNFYARLKAGSNFTVRTYSRIHRWLDEQPAAKRCNGTQPEKAHGDKKGKSRTGGRRKSTADPAPGRVDR